MLLWQMWGDDLWQLYHKVTFDGVNRLIIVNDGETEIDIRRDIYSDWKEWVQIRDYSKFFAACRTVGGDPTVGGNALGATFFTINNWRILISDNTTFTGNIFSDDFESPYLTAEDTKIALSEVSNLIDRVSVDPNDIIAAGVATTENIDDQTTTLQGNINTQTAIINNSISDQTTALNNSISDQTAIIQNDLTNLPNDVVAALNGTNYDGVPFADLMAIILSMAQGRIKESSSGVFEFYSQDNNTILYTLTKSGNERTRS